MTDTDRVADRPSTQSLVRAAVLRTAAVAAVLGIAAAVTIASHTSSTASAVSYLAKYSPARLADGRVWTLPTSAFLLGHPRMIGPTTFFVALIFLPYALWRGLARAGMVAMSGHILSTLVVFAAVLTASAFGSTTATSIAHTLDYGASAALAACAGGLAVALGRRVPAIGVLVLIAVASWFVYGLVTVGQRRADVPDVEHLLALCTGVVIEWRLETRRDRIGSDRSRPEPAGA